MGLHHQIFPFILVLDCLCHSVFNVPLVCATLTWCLCSVIVRFICTHRRGFLCDLICFLKTSPCFIRIAVDSLEGWLVQIMYYTVFCKSVIAQKLGAWVKGSNNSITSLHTTKSAMASYMWQLWSTAGQIFSSL